jgi:hypothetical protein
MQAVLGRGATEPFFLACRTKQATVAQKPLFLGVASAVKTRVDGPENSCR